MAHAQNLVKDIQVRGNATVNREAILSAMSLKVGAVYSEEKRVADQQSVQDLGYFKAVRIIGVPDATGNDWMVRVDVEEYPSIKEIRVSGNTVVKTAAIVAKLPTSLQPGHIFNLNERRAASQAITDLYSSKGYLAEITRFEPLEGSPGTLNIELVETKVGQISVQGNKITKDRIIRRLIRTRPGDVYSKDKWRSDLTRLYGTGWFDDINTDPTPGDEIGVVDLTLDLKEARTGTFNVGLQLDPRNSLAGIVRYSQANVGGTGQSFGVNFLQSTQGVGPSLDLDYTNPFIDNQNTTLRASLYSRVIFRFQGGLFGSGNTSFTKDNQYNERRTGGSIGFSRPVHGENSSVGISLRAEDVRTENLKTTTSAGSNNFIRQDGPVAVATLGFTQDRRDVPIDASRGDWVQFSLEPGFSNINRVGGLTSDNSIIGPNFFGKASFEYRRYFSSGPPRGFKLDDPRKVLAFRLRGGTILGEVPFFEQYFAGGSESVRGYQEDRFWGRQTITSTMEYRFPIQKSFSLVAFVDYGGAWGGYGSVNNFSQSDQFKLHLGYGPGVSFKAGPLGNIQLYLGFNEDGKSRTHFLIGNSF
jgi:outer membrane protein insertion porin family